MAGFFVYLRQVALKAAGTGRNRGADSAESDGPMMQLGPDPVYRCTWCDRVYISRDRLVHHEAACPARFPRMAEFDRLLDRYEARLRADGLLRTKH